MISSTLLLCFAVISAYGSLQLLQLNLFTEASAYVSSWNNPAREGSIQELQRQLVYATQISTYLEVSHDCWLLHCLLFFPESPTPEIYLVDTRPCGRCSNQDSLQPQWFTALSTFGSPVTQDSLIQAKLSMLFGFCSSNESQDWPRGTSQSSQVSSSTQILFFSFLSGSDFFPSPCC